MKDRLRAGELSYGRKILKILKYPKCRLLLTGENWVLVAHRDSPVTTNPMKHSKIKRIE